MISMIALSFFLNASAQTAYNAGTKYDGDPPPPKLEKFNPDNQYGKSNYFRVRDLEGLVKQLTEKIRSLEERVQKLESKGAK